MHGTNTATIKSVEYKACPICGSSEISMVTSNEVFRYKGVPHTMRDCEKMVCRNCGESIFTDETSDKVWSYLETI